MSLAFRRTCLLAALALLATFAPLAHPALAVDTTYTVTSLADTAAAGTLRWAITQANANDGADTINFNIASAQPWTITVASSLPALTDPKGVTIDGSVGGVPKIEIRGYNGTTSVAGQGILISSSNNVIRGLIISGFTFDSSSDYRGSGIVVSGYGLANAPSNNTIELCYLGTDYTGSAAGPGGTSNNFYAGIILEYGASSTTVQNNVISGNNQWGIYFYSDTALSQQNNTITNNKIGVNAAGTAAVPNGSHGVLISNNSNNNVIGPGNIISGNGAKKNPALYGVFISGARTGGGYISGNQVKGNKIGTDATGNSAIPNTGATNQGSGGIGIGQSQNTLIGGPAAADGNQISGNQEYGVTAKDISPGAVPGITGAVIQNNKIGVAADGVTKLANSQGGVLLWSKASGVTVGPGNLIAGNAFYGVRILGVTNQTDPTQQTRNNTITGNYIGTDASGTQAISNGSYGIRIQGGSASNNISSNIIRNHSAAGLSLEADTGSPPLSPTNNTITSNQIVANTTTGIQLLGASINNIIGPGNTITNHSTSGLAIATSQNTVKGNTISGNQIGITITGAATGNTIGGSNPGDGNNLINNTINGVLVSGAGTINNKITHTTTNGNGDKGIKLNTGGNVPILGATLSVTPPASGFTLTGNASGCAGGCTIEIFTDDSPLDNEGPTFLPATPPLTGINGAFSVDISGCKHYLIFTLTDSAGNTSEFFSPTASIPQCVPSAPVVVLSAATPPSPQSALPGASKTFQHMVTNTGTAAGALTITTSSSNGWTTTLDTSACPATLAPNGGSCNITLTVTVPANAVPGESNDTTITAALAGAATSASQIDRTSALLNAGLTLTPATQTMSTGPGQPVSYVHTLTNTGNGPDSFAVSVSLAANMVGWSSSVTPAGPISLAPNGSTQVTVTYTPAAGIASPPDYTATVRATSTTVPSVFQDVTDVTTITTAAVPQITSVVTPSSIDPGSTADIAYTITNVGNIDGTFTLAFSTPAGWTAAPPTLTPVFIAKGTSTTVNVTFTSPALALAGTYPISFSATADATATKIDAIVVKQKAALVWSPDPATFTRPPNQTFTDTLTLTNSGNFTDTIGLTASSNRGWSVQPIPATVTLNPGASAPIEVRMTIPPGQLAGLSNTTSVTATSQLPAVTATAHITTTIAAVPGVTLASSSPAQQTIDAGKPMTYTFTLQNSGSITQSYTITRTAVPSGWNSSLSPLTTPTLQPGETRTVTFTLTSPAGTPDGTQANVDVTAACKENACTAAKATVRLTVGPPFSVGVGGNCDGPALPGAVVTCVHTVTNTGFSSDTYLITTLSQLGWSTGVGPAILFLAPGASRTVTITLAVPSSADAGLQHMLTFTARSTALPSVSQSLIDTTTILQVAGVSFSPSLSTPIVGGQLVQFQHTVLNTGNGLDTYTITATQALNWSITIVPTTTNALPRGTYQTIQVSIQVPPGATTAVSNRITLRATSKFTPAIFGQLDDIVGSPQNVGIRWYFTYLPNQR